MAKLEFDPIALRRAFAMAKVVKPESNDLCLRFGDGGLTIVAQDRRRYVRAELQPKSSPDGLKSDDFYLTMDRSSLFESELESVVISLNEKSLIINAVGEGQTRQAVLKRRAERSRRPPLPPRPGSSGSRTVSTKELEDLLYQVSCSALVKETKTEEEMRVNQVHFYPNLDCASSNARFYASVSYLPGLGLDMSIVSSDIPVIRQFCSKIEGGRVSLYQDDRRLYVTDPDSGSVLSMTRVHCARPPFSSLSDDGFRTVLCVDRKQALKALQWAILALEGTQRLSLSASVSDGILDMRSDQTEISQFPIRFLQGSSLKADFPARVLHGVFSYMKDGEVEMRFDHKDGPTVLQISQTGTGPVRSFHFLQSMRARS